LFSSVSIIFVLWLTNTWHQSYLGDASYIIVFLAFAQIFWGQANFLTSYMVSRQDTQSIIVCGLRANVVGLMLFLAFFCYYQSLNSAIIGFLLFASMPFLINAHRVLPNNKEVFFFYKPKLLPSLLRSLSHYSLVLIVGAIAIPVTQIYLRDYVGEILGWLYVGYWQAVLRISDAHMQFFGVVNLSVLLPYLSRLNKEKILNLSNKSVVNIFIAIFGVSILSSLTLILLKDWIILVLFSSDFSAIAPFVVLQTVGDFFKVLLALVVVVCLAKGYWKIALCSELLQAFVLYLMTIVFLPYYEMKALMLAYICSSILSLLVMGLLLWKQR
jgi:polysaccharide transporter, PST family